MMKTKLDISIPTPCQENWANMQANNLGRYCLACQKTVIDFTQKSDQEIAAMLMQSNGKICGRFYEHQLKPIYLPEPQVSKSNLKAYLFALANVVLASWFVPTQAQGQIKSLIKENPMNKLTMNPLGEEKNVKSETHIHKEDLLEKNIKTFNRKPHFISGFISTYQDSLPIVSAEIKLQDKVIAKTDENGYFEIELSKIQFVSKELELTFSAFGYENLIQKVNIAEMQNLDIKLEEAVYIRGFKAQSKVAVVGGVVCVRKLNFLERALLKIKHITIEVKDFFIKKPKKHQ